MTNKNDMLTIVNKHFAKSVSNKGFNPNQPRDKSGRWTRYGGGARGTGNTASTDQAIEIVKMQSYGARPEHVEKYLKDNDIDYVEAYHVTKTTSVDSIKSSGIKESYQENRPDATYFFLDKDDALRNADNLGHRERFSVVTIKIPASNAKFIKDDGFYNGTFSWQSYSAARLLDKIPRDWIDKSETYKFVK